MASMKQHLEEYAGDAKVDFQDFVKTKLKKTEEPEIAEALALLEKIGRRPGGVGVGSQVGAHS